MMFRNQRLIKPKKRSVLGALAIVALTALGSQISAYVGYLVGVSALLVLVVAMWMDSIWPTKGKEENAIVFSLFWGLMIGGILPFLITTYLDGGVNAVFEIFTG
jgi:uncharacterized membrane protein